MLNKHIPIKAPLAVMVSAFLLTACIGGGGGGGGGGDGGGSQAETPRPPTNPVEPPSLSRQQERIRDGFYKVDMEELPFDSLVPGNPQYDNTSRWYGVLNGAGYRIEVPENWNGMLVMFAHGHHGSESKLTVTNPDMRDYLIDKNYAWAASSYSANAYDVRMGVEDTNALALAFNEIAADNGRVLEEPTKYYITGISMGGHIAAAAVEYETYQNANNFVPYAASAPLCGAVADSSLFDFFAAQSLALAHTAGADPVDFPLDHDTMSSHRALAIETLFNNFDSRHETVDLTENGWRYYNILENLSGGPRPLFRESFMYMGDLTFIPHFFGNTDFIMWDNGTLEGVWSGQGVDTQDITYRFETKIGDPLSIAETRFNNTIGLAIADADVNEFRDDGLRPVPKVNGDLYDDIPVLSVHTIGDMLVPLSMQQIYAERISQNGWGSNLVQRVIRAPGHCDFTPQERAETMEALFMWEQYGIKPEGDNLMDKDALADPNFGCSFTRDGLNDPLRQKMPRCT